jgi:hypothetical protein
MPRGWFHDGSAAGVTGTTTDLTTPPEQIITRYATR